MPSPRTPLSPAAAGAALVLAVGLAAVGCEQPKPWAVAQPDPTTRRTTQYGDVVGGEGRSDSHAWLGIPFAAPPIGELRGRAPRPPTSWTGTREALHFASVCPQFPSPLGASANEAGHAGNEDCLYLNIWAPRFAPGAVPKGGDRRPVLLWIHGGGNSLGGAPFYDGGHLASAERVIVVSTQYRLGPFGWFRHRSLREEVGDPDDQSGNFGTLDLIRSLEWIRDNIAAFGGDPGNVTIFGESAGGMNVYSLLFAPKARGLFHRAISESGGLRNTALDEAEHFADDPAPGHKSSSEEVLLRLLEKDGAPDRGAAKARRAAMSDRDVAKYLRSQSTDEILDAYSLRIAGMIDMPLVFEDGAVLRDGDWLHRLSTPDGWNRVPVIVGTNRDEFKLFLFLNPKLTWKLLGLFPRMRDENLYLAGAEHLSEAWKATGADEPASAMRRSGWNEVYVYRFDWDEEPTSWGTDLSKMLGAAHGVEIPFVFGHFHMGRLGRFLYSPDTTESREKLSNAMMSYWTEFAAQGSPGRGRKADLPEWTAGDDSSPARPEFMVLATQHGGGLRMSADDENRRKVIEGVDADPRLATQRDKCRLSRELVRWERIMTKEEYVHAGKSGCADFSFDQFSSE